MPQKNLALEIASQSCGNPPRRPAPLKYKQEPSARDLDWYLQWTRDYRRPTAIAADCNPPVSKSTVARALTRVGHWMRLQLFETVVKIRMRQTHALEHRIEETLHEWEQGKDVKYLNQARGMMAEIRRMWGVDAPARLELETRSVNLPRVDGMTRAEAIEATARTLLATAESIKRGAGEFGTNGGEVIEVSRVP